VLFVEDDFYEMIRLTSFIEFRLWMSLDEGSGSRVFLFICLRSDFEHFLKKKISFFI
jgi:hypothetical protein